MKEPLSRIPLYSSLIPHPSSLLKFRRGDLLDDVALDLVADLDVVEVLQADAALVALAHLGHVVLHAPKAGDAASHATTPSRMRRARVLRRIKPSITRQPATVPTFGT